MKYRIENGEAKISLNDLNKLNDLAEKLEALEKEIDEKIDSRLFCIEAEHINFYNGSPEKRQFKQWVPLNEAMKKMADDYESLKKDYEIKKDALEAASSLFKEQEKEFESFKSMSVFEFFKYKRENK